MGQAKRRGTFEQRQGAAIARNQAIERALNKKLAEHNAKAMDAGRQGLPVVRLRRNSAANLALALLSVGGCRIQAGD
jgi:hypothetical protein